MRGPQVRFCEKARRGNLPSLLDGCLGIVGDCWRRPVVGQAQVSVILELLRGADLESTSRKYRVTAATLSQWRDRFLTGGEVGLKTRRDRSGRRGAAPLEVRGRHRQHRKRVTAGKDRPHGEWPPFGVLEVETMSRTVSPSSNRPYG